jgi:hypothetical protein
MAALLRDLRYGFRMNLGCTAAAVSSLALLAERRSSPPGGLCYRLFVARTFRLTSPAAYGSLWRWSKRGFGYRLWLPPAKAKAHTGLPEFATRRYARKYKNSGNEAKKLLKTKEVTVYEVRKRTQFRAPMQALDAIIGSLCSAESTRGYRNFEFRVLRHCMPAVRRQTI